MNTRTMYMHTLDGQPATYAIGHDGKPYLYFVVGRNRAALVDSLRHLRMQQRWCRTVEMRDGLSATEYGYVLVQVPS
jgi:hypothetical protein